MVLYKISKYTFLQLLIFLLILLFLPHFIISLLDFPYPLNLSELLINYQGGFIRRGIFGEVILKIYQIFKINPLTLLSYIFIFIYLIQIFIFYKLLKKYNKNYFLLIFILLGPATILFSVYDVNAYMTKDKFVNIAILAHAFFACYFIKKIDLKNYNLFLIFFLIPIINFNFLMYEPQLLFLGVHILISSYVYQMLSKKSFFKSKYIYTYLIILIPLFIIALDSNLSSKIELIQVSLLKNFPFIYEKFIHETVFVSMRELEGNLNLKIGAIMKLFGLFKYSHIEAIMVSFFLSVGLIFVIFHARLNNYLMNLSKNINFNYLFLLLPCLIVPFIVTDFGRSFNMVSIHFLAFYLIFPNEFNTKKFTIFKINKIIERYVFSVLLFFYCFFWMMPHAVGWQPIMNSKNSSLLEELVNLSKYTYNITDRYLITLPKAEFMK